MPGPAPKDASARAGHKQPVFGEWRDLPPLEKPVLPKLPRGQWSAQTKALWEGLRQDFATQEYGPSEIATAIQLAYLIESAVTDGKATMWSEVRQWMDRLMLTPKGKRDARVRLQQVDSMPALRSITTPNFKRAAG